jgi:hypothetical protein
MSDCSGKFDHNSAECKTLTQPPARRVIAAADSLLLWPGTMLPSSANRLQASAAAKQHRHDKLPTTDPYKQQAEHTSTAEH